jgi:hypothetical protein
MTASESRVRIRLRLADLVLPVGSLLLLATMLALVLSAAGNTLGYDFEAYVGAAHRLVNGDRLYDSGVTAAGGFAIYLYPPPFALALTPLTLLPDAVARWAWVLAVGCCLPIGAYLMPVRRDVRWTIVCLGALSWPFLYSVKLGQVGPLLFLLFASAWRWRDRAGLMGISMAIGALVKVQPGILVVWATVSGRRRAAAVAILTSVFVVAVSTVFTGVGAWSDYFALLLRVSAAVTTPHNCSPGAVLYQAGFSEEVAGAGQWLSTAAAVGALLLLWRWGRAEASFMGTIVVSQLLTPLLWDHYAVLLLLPTAWLMQRGRTWAVVIPLLGWISLFSTTESPNSLAAASIPLTFFGVLALLLWEAYRERGIEKRDSQAAATEA